MKKFFSAICLLSVFWLSAQSPIEELEQYRKKYAFTKIVKLQDDMLVDISLNKDETLNITKTIIETDFILDKQASRYNKAKIQYSDLIALNYIAARTLYPTEKKYKAYKVEESAYATKDKLGGSIFFDDTKEVNYVYPKMTTGAKRVKEYQLQIKEPRFLGSFYFQSSYPIEKSELQVVTDLGIDLGFNTFNTDTFDIKYTKEEKKGRLYHTWTASNMPKYKHETATLDAAYFIPHIVLYIKTYTTKAGKQNLLSSVDDLHNWYFDLVKDVNTQDNSSLKPIVDSLIENTTTDLEKVKNIYAWVQSNIKYVAFEDAYGGFIPREAVDICNKRYGDCKDMSSIITEMLELAKVKADLTWIGTRDIPYTYNEVFTPSVDNHMIASFTDTDGEIYFLDATSSYLPFGIVSEFIQGKQAMINVGEGKYKLADVPITKAADNLVYDSVSIRLEKDIIKGNGKFAITGYPKVKYSYFYPTKTAKEKREYVKNAFEKGSNKFIVSKTADYHFDDKDKASEIVYDFEIADYTNHADDEVYINLHLDKYLKSSKFEEDRELPYDAKFKYINKQIVRFEVPEGFAVHYIPENDRFEDEQFTFDIKYTQTDQAVILESIVSVKSLVIAKEKFENWNEMIKKLNKNYSEVLIIKKK